MILEKWRENEHQLRSIGEKALADASASSAAVYYCDARYGDRVVKEMPDGRRQLVTLTEDGEQIEADIPPRLAVAQPAE